MAPNPTLDGKFFAIEGELIGHHGQGHVVEISTTVFNKMSTQVVVPSADLIATEVAADPTIAVMGPIHRRRRKHDRGKVSQDLPHPPRCCGPLRRPAGGDHLEILLRHHLSCDSE